MESILKITGRAGIGGTALGVLLLLFKDLLQKMKVPFLTSAQWYNIVIMFMILVWSIAIIGIILTLYIKLKEKKKNPIKREKNIVKNITRVKEVRIGDKEHSKNGVYDKKNIVGSVEDVDVFEVGDGR